MKNHNIILKTNSLHWQPVSEMPIFKAVYIGPDFDPRNKLKEFVVFDTETTGLDPESDDIVQLSAVKFKNLKAVETWNTYLDPRCNISESASLVNGITDEMVKDAPKINQVAEDFFGFVGNAPIVGYNIKFDLSFMWCAGIDLITGRDIYDVMLSAYVLFPKGTIPNRKLTTIAEALGISFDAHDSLEDSLATGEVLVRICKQYCAEKPKKKLLTSRDLKRQMAMDYDTQIEHLLRKYGPAKYHYFISEDNLTKNKSISRTAEGLECHHIDENIIPTLSDPDIASMYSFDYQKNDRLVYCNLLEHLLLHIKIGQDRYYVNHKYMYADSPISELITHGVSMLTMQINRLYENNIGDSHWEQNCFDVIKDRYNDYVEMLKQFQYFIVEHVLLLSEFEKPVYIGRPFIDKKTSSTGKIVEVTDDEVTIKIKREYWTYERDAFTVDRILAHQLESIHEKLSSREDGINIQVYEDSNILDT